MNCKVVAVPISTVGIAEGNTDGAIVGIVNEEDGGSDNAGSGDNA